MFACYTNYMFTYCFLCMDIFIKPYSQTVREGSFEGNGKTITTKKHIKQDPLKKNQKKPRENQKKQKKHIDKLFGEGPLEKNQKNIEKTKKNKKKQYLQTLWGGPLREKPKKH